MSGNHPKTEEWERQVHKAIVATDHAMEALYGEGVHLRHNRPASKTTSNPQMDGLFNIGLVFTPGYNSELGRGYWLDLEVASRVPPSPELHARYVESCRTILEAELRKIFPERDLRFEADSGRWKLRGNFTLGSV